MSHDTSTTAPTTDTQSAQTSTPGSTPAAGAGRAQPRVQLKSGLHGKGFAAQTAMLAPRDVQRKEGAGAPDPSAPDPDEHHHKETNRFVKTETKEGPPGPNGPRREVSLSVDFDKTTTRAGKAKGGLEQRTIRYVEGFGHALCQPPGDLIARSKIATTIAEWAREMAARMRASNSKEGGKLSAPEAKVEAAVAELMAATDTFIAIASEVSNGGPLGKAAEMEVYMGGVGKVDTRATEQTVVDDDYFKQTTGGDPSKPDFKPGEEPPGKKPEDKKPDAPEAKPDDKKPDDKKPDAPGDKKPDAPNDKKPDAPGDKKPDAPPAGKKPGDEAPPPTPPPIVPKITDSEIVVDQKVFFESDKAVLLPAGVGTMQQVASLMSQHTRIELLSIEGHTDSTGSDAHNRSLSSERANAVRDALLGAGVASSRLTTAFFGEKQPIADNKTKEGRARNRRVVLRIAKSGKAAPDGEGEPSKR